ncbi:uncharacterized protein LOC120124751 [Hibiscus syriacus]|uniref:uncharacterized protein LOC120124751 n=1 Tax=Hibiscus syriacus TaxID=106335 RepID=UPI0019223B74|nr:uncharacterized protein LOC120124751 [Hibiscus syriacus]
MARLIVLLWNIWNWCNKFVHEGEVQEDREVIIAAWNIYFDFFEINGRTAHYKVKSFRLRIWTKPLDGVIKINVDGAYSSTAKFVSLGVVARNSYGLVLGGLCRRILHPCNTEVAEVEAVTRGLKFAIDNGWDNVIIEGDAITIVNKIVNWKDDVSIIGLLRNETHGMLSSNEGFKLFYVNRKANKTAHSLAQ